ncbi:MAG TPA: M15 family metallopeptidase [Hyphomonadaceae bacterium]|nr:M15 family metallopeptidase [Hyphomonadaceae bacterium]
MMRAVLAALLVAGCAHAQAPDAGSMDRSGFVDVAAVAPGLVVDMRYFGAENFIGRPIAGYEAPVCLLTREAGAALGRVQAKLATFGLGLKVFDCYRPQRAVADFVVWAKDLSDQARKSVQYPNVDKSRLFELGYIAEKSGHSRGSTVDLALVDLASGAEVDMGSGYDLFDTLSWPGDPRPSAQARVNRAALQAAMTGEGFRPLKEEWWHFTLNGEPYPETYFDFVVR